MLCDLLAMFDAGAARRRVICGETVTTLQLLDLMQFDESIKHQEDMIREVVGGFMDDEARQLFRMATGLNAIPPRGCEITLRQLEGLGGGVHPYFSTCDRSVSSEEVVLPVKLEACSSSVLAGCVRACLVLTSISIVQMHMPSYDNVETMRERMHEALNQKNMAFQEAECH